MTDSVQTGTSPSTEQASVSAPTFGPASMLISAGVGFGIGILITLAFVVPLLSKDDAKKHHSASPPPVHMDRAQLKARITSLANTALGFSSLSGKNRLLNVKVAADIPLKYRLQLGETAIRYNATVSFLLNPNPFSQFDVRSARSDAFQLLKALYGQSLPLDRVTMIGRFQFPDSHRRKVVMRAVSDPSVANSFAPWQKLSRASEEPKVWNALTPHWIARRFANYHGGS